MRQKKLQALCDSLTSPTYFLHSRIHKMKTLDLYIKRDDELGCTINGSKLRKYASIIPFLRGLKNPIVALVGCPYSNHILSFVQILKQEGIPYCLFLTKPKEKKTIGNFFFLSLLTAGEEIFWVEKVPHPLHFSWTQSWEEKLQKKFLWIPLGGCIPEGLPGALTLPLDILCNEKTEKKTFPQIFIDAGTGLTAAALLLGMAYLQKETMIHVVLIAGKEIEFISQLFFFREHLSELLQEEVPVPSQYKILLPSTAKSFGAYNQTVLNTIARIAKKEGIFLDPLYTAKLFLTTEQNAQPNSLWIHSGGTLSLAGFQSKNFFHS